jgi:single-strand DNA-binding protein
MNLFAISGNIGADIEKLTTSGGADLAKASIGVKEYYGGEEKTHWIEVVLWGKLSTDFAEICAKGDNVTVTGKINKRSWTDRDGQNRATYEFVGLHWELNRRAPGNERPAQEQEKKEAPQYSF